MNSTVERMLSLRVADVMNAEIVTVPAHGTMSQAADILSENRITGAPVVDESGRCVGVLSSTDFVYRKLEKDGGINTTHDLTSRTSTGCYQIEEVRHDLVCHHMSPAVQTIAEQRTLTDAARCMCDEHVHRLIVVDDNAIPIGMVTSLDIVSAWVGAVEE